MIYRNIMYLLAHLDCLFHWRRHVCTGVHNGMKVTIYTTDEVEKFWFITPDDNIDPWY